MGKLMVLMVTAFVDMVGLLAIVPLLPFYALEFGANGLAVGLLVSSFSLAQLISAPFWGRISDRYGRRPALLAGLTASAIAYVVFAFSDSILMLLISRLVQGAGGGTVGVIQAYVADATEPQHRARGLGWLSAATNLGVTVGPALGSLAARLGMAAPGLFAAGLCVVNIAFAWRYLTESHTEEARRAGPTLTRSSHVVKRVIRFPGEAAPRLIWVYTLAMGAFQGMTAVFALFLAARHGVTEESIGWFFMYIGAMSVVTRAFILGRLVDWLGEVRLARVGLLTLAAGLALMPVAPDRASFLALVTLVPLGTAFTFPCVTALLSHVIPSRERGLYMGVQQTFGGVARVLAPIGAGLAWDRLGHGVPFWISALFVLASLLVMLGAEAATSQAEVRTA